MDDICKNLAMTSRKSTSPHRVAVLVRHGVMPLELGLVHQTFGVAQDAKGRLLYDVRTCALVPGEVRTDADFRVWVFDGAESLAEADTVVVPASHESDETLCPGGLDDAMARALAIVPARSRVASICTGSFVLAAAGLLDGLRATTHWKSAALMQRTFPTVRVDPDVLYTDEGRVLTSAGEASGLDLCLHMIRCDHGSAVANDVARSTVVPPHREGGQAQFIRRPVPEPGAGLTSSARAWALEHLDRLLTLRDLASREATSVRTLTRRFAEEVGVSPMQWLTQQRLDRARELLEETDLPVERIARDVGFGTGASLRSHLNDSLGISPSTYRSHFRGTGVPDNAHSRAR
jgi:transcriptional regulator GlxA family with amidase domain